MGTSSAGTRRLCVAVDQERYSHRDNVGQFSTQRRLVDVLGETIQGVLPQAAGWEWQSTGDGALGVLPAGLDEPRAVAGILHELGIALYQRNRDLAEHARLRLRVAMHSGIVHEAANGYAGDAVVVTCRLLDAEELKAALREHRGTDLALIVSAPLYDDVVRHNYRDLHAETFQRVEVSHPRKGFAASAWIHVPVPGGRDAPEDGAAAPRGGDPPASGDAPDAGTEPGPEAEGEPGGREARSGSGGDRYFAQNVFRDVQVEGGMNFDQRGTGPPWERGPSRGDADA